MPWKFGKKLETKEEKTEEKQQVKHKSDLEVFCEKYGRLDLYKPLSMTLPSDPQNILPKDMIDLTYGGLLLYEGKTDEARKIWEKLMNDDPGYGDRLKPILENLDDVSKIARDWWTELAVREYEEILKIEEAKKAEEAKRIAEEAKKAQETSKSKP
jgi:hypothetical protein